MQIDEMKVGARVKAECDMEVSGPDTTKVPDGAEGTIRMLHLTKDMVEIEWDLVLDEDGDPKAGDTGFWFTVKEILLDCSCVSPAPSSLAAARVDSEDAFAAMFE